MGHLAIAVTLLGSVIVAAPVHTAQAEQVHSTDTTVETSEQLIQFAEISNVPVTLRVSTVALEGTAHLPDAPPATEPTAAQLQAPVAPTTVVATRTMREPRVSHLPWYLAGAGGVLALGGLATDLFLIQPLRNKTLMTATSGQASLDAARNVSYGMVGVGAAAAIVGLFLHYTVFKGPADGKLRLSADTVNSGAVVQLGWIR